MRRTRLTLALIGASIATAALAGAAGAPAASLQSVGSFAQPTFVSSDPSNPEQLLVVEREGRIVQVENGSATTIADISSAVDPAGEGGLLSIAPAADFDSTGRLYVFYTGEEQSSPEIHIAALRAGPGAGGTGELRNLVTIPHPEEDNHYGGQLQIGPDGRLYASTGDGGGADDKHRNAQNPDSLLGKILRIDQNALFPIPEVWALGLRNPFRFSFDRLGGEIFIGDVGQSAWEEIDRGPPLPAGAGRNYGWSCREGLFPGPGTSEDPLLADPLCAGKGQADFADPIVAYANTGTRCAVIGGYVVRDRSLGDLYGRYVYGDYCSGEIRSFELGNPSGSDRSEGLVVNQLNSFGEDSCGRIYAASAGGGVYRLVGSSPLSCAPPPAVVAKRTTILGIRAASRRVIKRKRAVLSVWASPCEGRRGDRVTLMRGRVRVGSRALDRACSARFRPKITRRGKFRATIRESATFLAAETRKITIKPRRPAKKQRRHRR